MCRLQLLQNTQPISGSTVSFPSFLQYAELYELPLSNSFAASVAIPNVHPSTSMGYTNYLTYQFWDETIRGVNVSWAAENTSFFPAALDSGQNHDLDEWQIPTAGVPGTHMSITALSDVSGGVHLAVFFQTEGDDFKMWSRDNSAGFWTSADVPVDGTS